MEDKTQRNLYEAFVGEAKAHRRLLAFARKAEKEGYPQVAKLFRAISAAEGVHADNHLRLLGEAVVRDTQANLDFSFETEKTVNGVYYPQFIKKQRKRSMGSTIPSSSKRRKKKGIGQRPSVSARPGTWRKGTPGCTRRPCATCCTMRTPTITSVRSAVTSPMERCLNCVLYVARKRNCSAGLSDIVFVDTFEQAGFISLLSLK
jgi:rubrerythrin